MAWNPHTYYKFKEERFAPFYNLLQLIETKENMQIVDLGCGTGEQTAELRKRLPGSTVKGIDASAEMLAASTAFKSEGLSFEQVTVQDYLATNPTHDLVFSNAALQWVPDHETLLPAIIKTIRKGGQFVSQVPSQHNNVTNQILNEIASRDPFDKPLKNWVRTSAVLTTDRYAQILFENGGSDIQVFEKIFPLILESSDALYEWLSGTTIIPYLERLPEAMHEEFVNSLKKELANRFPKRPVFYPFKRILFSAKFL